MNSERKIECLNDNFWKLPNLKKFLEDNKRTWWIIGILLIIVYGIKVFNVSITHDTEAIIAQPDDLYYAWTAMGRFGLIFLKKLFNLYIFNPYVASFLSVFLMLLGSMIWTYLFCWLRGNSEKDNNNWIFPAVFLTSMLAAEQFGFILQSVEVNLAIILLGLSVIILYHTILSKDKWYKCIPAVFMSMIAFSCYQTLVPMFVAAVSFGFLMVYDRISISEYKNIKLRLYWGIIGKLILAFILSLTLYQVINKIILFIININTTEYITDQIKWGVIPDSECVKNILNHIFNALTGEGIFYTAIYGVIYFAAVVFILASILKLRRGYLIYILASLISLLSPFMLTVVLGSAPTARTDIVLPFMAGLWLQYIVNGFDEKNKTGIKKTGYWCAALFSVFFVIFQSMDSARLYYTQYMQYEMDVSVAEKISDRIEKLGLGENPEEPVVFIGSMTFKLNDSCYKDEQLELVGKSFFSISFGTYHGTYKMNQFFDVLGYSYAFPSSDEVEQAEKDSANMPSWPDEGSVILKDGVIIVKLS